MLCHPRMNAMESSFARREKQQPTQYRYYTLCSYHSFEEEEERLRKSYIFTHSAISRFLHIYSLFLPHPTTGSFSIHRSPTHTHTCHSLQRRSSFGVIDWTGWLFGWIALHYVHDTALTHDGDIITTTATRTRTTGFPQHFVAVHSFLHEYEPNDRYW